MATSVGFAGQPASPSSLIPSTFAVYDNRFLDIIGPAPKLEVILENDTYPFAHEAGVFIPNTNELYLSSNQFIDPATQQKTIVITKVNLGNDSAPVTAEILNTDIPMANGGINYEDGILWCGQGTLNSTGGLFYMSIQAPYTSELLIGNFYGRQFNSLNDVVVHADGSMWFTDPIYGSEQKIRPAPRLPNQVYRFDPKTKEVRVVADRFGRTNGISFSPDQRTVYITDTDYNHGDGTMDPTRVSTIYAYNLTMTNGAPTLSNRRVFAMADTGAPDGIKTDLQGNVYSGCGDGINIWSPGGVLLGKILVKGGIANFSFGRNGRMFLLGENKLWVAQLSSQVKGSILNI
ncbi:calcium-dependent phosphotriesterase [Aspergillus pseudocaelatus]|uniref:Calcium-dependent phosphotriesterase n=1 Tax=Aspergillus pseudocaelatus TaxID=1825620 RepID=A0ABQ6WR93_9EURO|nr:calcium-dependent phosphotriesterase [Aspergillus pseudocaelatus]